MPLLSILSLTACLSEQQASDRFQEFVAEHQDCDVAEDCVTMFPGCPLGCATAVRADALAEAEELAEQLVSQYERFGRSCAYSCLGSDGATCEGGVCAVLTTY